MAFSSYEKVSYKIPRAGFEFSTDETSTERFSSLPTCESTIFFSTSIQYSRDEQPDNEMRDSHPIFRRSSLTRTKSHITVLPMSIASVTRWGFLPATGRHSRDCTTPRCRALLRPQPISLPFFFTDF
jgi:hypothetical protein